MRRELDIKVTGHCHCGRISFAAEVDAARVRVCHCSDCQNLSGSAFRTNVPVVAGTFALRGGEPKSYAKTADSGNKVTHTFCADCGSPIYSLTATEPPVYSLRVGTLDQRAELLPSRQIWCRSALRWAMELSGVARTERHRFVLPSAVQEEAAMKVTGRCHCGKVGFEAEIDPGQVRICHCTDCQTLSGTAFRVNVASLPGTFRLTSGTPKTYIKTTADSGNHRSHGFCGDCGTPLWATSPEPNPASYGLRVGTLDRRIELTPSRQGWFRSALPWSQDLGGVRRIERQ